MTKLIMFFEDFFCVSDAKTRSANIPVQLIVDPDAYPYIIYHETPVLYGALPRTAEGCDLIARDYGNTHDYELSIY